MTACRSPYADVFLHAGDFTGTGKWEEISAFNDWLGKLPHRFKVLIAGNHDFPFDVKHERFQGVPGSTDRVRDAERLLKDCSYLLDQEIVVWGIRIWGSPHTPYFGGWAFNESPGAEIRRKWDLIPEGIDILVTHGPPFGVLDVNKKGEHCGCVDLLDAVRRIKPRYHLFGHIHEGYGQSTIFHSDGSKTICLNGSALGERIGSDPTGRPINSPFVFNLEPRENT